MRGGTRVVTVEAEVELVESRLRSGRVSCPGCGAGLRPWGWARRRPVVGVGVLQPRRSRCPQCARSHVLLPVTVLLRRAYGVGLIGAALAARAGGMGHRVIAGRLGVPAATVRGWVRVMGGRLEEARIRFLRVAAWVGVDVSVPAAAGSPWRDWVGAVAAATAAVTGRFGSAGVGGVVTMWQVASACSAGRLLAPGWPGPDSGG